MPESKFLDDVSSVDSRQVATASVSVIDRLQDYTSGTQIQALAMLYILMAEHLGADVRQELQRAERVMTDADGYYKPEVRALKAYVRGELK